MNTTKTFLLLAVMTAIFGVIGFAIGGAGGMIMGLMVAAGMNIFAYWNSDKAVLSMYGAKAVESHHAPELYNMVQKLAQNGNLPMPKLYILETEQPNAFATGRDPEHAAVAVTSGLMRILESDELAGVIAHELAHIKNRDTLIMTVTATIAGAIGMIANIGMFLPMLGSSNNQNEENNAPSPIMMMLLAVIAPIVAGIVQMAISRTREYEADKMGAEICKNPLSLARALAKIEQSVRGGSHNYNAEKNPATAHMFIINPLFGKGSDNLFSTHPATANRIKALQEMAQKMGNTTSYPKNTVTDSQKASPWG